MAEQQQTNPEAEAALAKVLAEYRRTITDTDAVKAIDLHQAQQVSRDPGPLLEALAQAGVLETEHGEKRGEVTHDGGGCFSIHYDPYARLVSPWKPVSGDE